MHTYLLKPTNVINNLSMYVLFYGERRADTKIERETNGFATSVRDKALN